MAQISFYFSLMNEVFLMSFSLIIPVKRSYPLLPAVPAQVAQAMLLLHAKQPYRILRLEMVTELLYNNYGYDEDGNTDNKTFLYQES